MVIDTLQYEDVRFGNDPALLIRINAFKTNIKDGYVKTDDDTIRLKGTEKLGSENYLFALYPYLYKEDQKNKFRWFILFYADPNKDNTEISRVIKLVLNKILKIKHHHVTVESIMKSLKDELDEVVITLYVLQDDGHDYILSELKPVEAQFKCQQEETYMNVPKKILSKLLDNFNPSKYKRLKVKINDHRREVKIEKNKVDEFTESIKEKVEETFNFTVSVSENDVNSGKIYETDFVAEKLGQVLLNYMESL